MQSLKKESSTAFKKNKSGGGERGVSLYFAVVITSLLLAIALGLTALFIGQLKFFKEMGNSVQAFFAADSGMENIIYLEKACNLAGCGLVSALCNADCTGFAENPATTSLQWGDISYNASAASSAGSMIFKSNGKYRTTQRAIQAAR